MSKFKYPSTTTRYVDVGKNLYVSKTQIGKRKDIKGSLNKDDHEIIAFCRNKHSTVYRSKPYIVWCDVRWLILNTTPVMIVGKSSKRNNRNVVSRPVSSITKIRKAKMTDCMAFKYFILSKESDIDE
jgi:hypothetical protein